MTAPFFIADNADVTVVRSVASSVFGKYSLSVPEGVDISDIHTFDAPGNELGYVASVAPLGKRVGGMARRCARADVAVTAADPRNPDWVAESNVDRVLREAADAVASDFFLESDVTRPGLGAWREFVDFNVGDLAWVKILGQWVKLPVTRIEPRVTDFDQNDVAVHLGGQVVEDSDAREVENETIAKALAAARRDLAGLGSQVAKAVADASDAKATAESVAQAVARDVDVLQAEVDRLALVSADGKSTNFYGVSAPENPQEGDAWFKPDTDGQVKIFIYGPDDSGVMGWREATPELDFSEAEQKLKANEEAIQAALGVVSDAQADVEQVRAALLGKVDTSAFDAAVAAREQALAGLQKQLSDSQANLSTLGADVANKLDASVYNAKMTALDESLASANSKNRVFYSTSVPGTSKGQNPGDTWYRYDTANRVIGMWQWDGSAWVVRTLDNAVVGTLDAGKLTSGVIDAARIGADTIDASKIKAGSIGAGELAAGAVTAGKIASNAVTAGTIAAGAVTAGNIQANAVGAREIAADSINATHMVLAQPGNLIANGDLTQGMACWNSALTFGTNGKVTPPNGRRLNTKAGQGSLNAHGTDNWFNVQPGASYAFEIWLYGETGSNIFIACRNQDGEHAGTAGPVVNEGDLWSGGGSHLINNRPLAAEWRRYSCVYTMGEKTTRARLGTFYFNHSNGTNRNATIYFGGVSLRPMADAQLIVDGSVTAKAIAAGTITAKEIASGTITAAEIASGTITAGNIKSGELTSDNVTIKNGAITSAMIKDLAVTNAKIADGTITAAKIGSVDAGKITSGTIDAQRIAANSISAQKLQITPGNLFPDPHFQDPCWGNRYSTDYNGSLALAAAGLQTGLYYQPSGVAKDTALKVEPGAVYRLTTRARFGGTKGVTFVSVYCRYVNTAGTSTLKKVGEIPRQAQVSYKAGTVSTNLTFPADMQSGECTIGFFVESDHPDGAVFLWDVQLVRAADASLIVDGSIQGRHIQANSINGDRIVAGTLDAKAIKAGTITASQVNADEIFLTKTGEESLNDQWEEMQALISSQQEDIQALLAQVTALKSQRIYWAVLLGYNLNDPAGHLAISGSRINATGDWVGQVRYEYSSSDGLMQYETVEITANNRSVTSAATSNRKINIEYVIYPLSPLPKVTLTNSSNFQLAQSTWQQPTGYSYTVPAKGTSAAVTAKMTFLNVNKGSTYGVRILLDGVVQKSWTSSRFGPDTVFGKSTWTKTLPASFDVKPGQRITVEAYGSNSTASKRLVSSASLAELIIYRTD